MAKRAHGYVSGIWDQHVKDNPRDDIVPYVLPIAFLQCPARNTPVGRAISMATVDEVFAVSS